jgi:hypothetical protein
VGNKTRRDADMNMGYINSLMVKAMSLNARIEAMKAENKFQEIHFENPPIYQDSAFDDISNELYKLSVLMLNEAGKE